MCGPLAVAGAGAALSIASSAAQYAGQSQIASQEQQAINTNLMSQYAQGQQQLIGRDTEANQKLQANLMQRRAAMGQLGAAAAENGVGGHSISALANEINSNAANYAGNVEQNRKMTDQEIGLQMQGFQAQAQNDLNQAKSPNPFGLLLNIGGAGLGAYSTYNSLSNPNSARIRGAQ